MRAKCPRGRSIARSALIALAALVLLASCGPARDTPGEAVPSRSAAITDGLPDDGHAAVGGLTNGGGICTATLIGWRTVISAAHCVRTGARYFFLLDGVWYRSRSAQRHPDYNAGSIAGTDDVAVVLLDRAPPVPHASISSHPPLVGQQVTLVGFGVTASGAYDSGVKRSAVNTVSSLSTLHVLYEGTGNGKGNICSGDSGGPAFATIEGREVQVGVHSWGQDPCGTLSASMRVDRYVDWLRQVSGGDVSVDGAPSELIDEAVPSLRIVAPVDGATVTTPFALKTAADDDRALSALEIYADGLLYEEIALGGTERAVERSVVLELPEGPHRLEAVAVDLLGQRRSATIEVSVHTPAPIAITDRCHFDGAGRWVCPSSGNGCAVSGRADDVLSGLREPEPWPPVLTLFALLVLGCRRRTARR